MRSQSSSSLQLLTCCSAWQVNTELLPFDLEEVKKDVEAGNSAKKNKQLWGAYEIAAEGRDLAEFKKMLLEHEEALQKDAEAREAKEAEKMEKKEKAAKRKSTAADSEDVDMEDADGATPSAKKTKATKKRKADSSDGDEPAAKTPKTTKLKLNNKTPKEGSTAKPKKETKSKKKAAEDATPAKSVEPELTPEERFAKREKQSKYTADRNDSSFH